MEIQQIQFTVKFAWAWFIKDFLVLYERFQIIKYFMDFISPLNGDNAQCLLNEKLLKEHYSEYICYDLKGASSKAIMYRFYKTMIENLF